MFTEISNLILALTAFSTVISANPPQSPPIAYVSPIELCKSLPTGKYCDPSFPRSFIDCPSSQVSYCGPNQVCANGDTVGTVKCIPNLWNPYTQVCLNKEPGTSYCYKNMTVNCPDGEVFLCPTDLMCKRRGRRAYCIQPRFFNGEPVTGFCNGLSRNGTVCHPTNLKKIINCPGETVQYCGLGHMCDVPNGADKACCVPFKSNLERFCSNKPLLSSFCIPESDGQLILCSQPPQILQCPSEARKCRQNLSIEARCV